MRNKYKAKKKKGNAGSRSSKIPDDTDTNNSSRNEEVESNGFGWYLQKVKYWFNPIKLTLILDECIR